MKALVTGADGFIGSHLVDMLLSKGLDVYATVYGRSKNLDHVAGRIKTIELDINDKEKIGKVISDVKPDYIFHMAAQAYVMPSWDDIEGTLKANIFGTMYILDAVKKAGINPKIVVACSSAGYGMTHENELPIKETKEFRPSSPYAISKIGADMICYLYAKTYGMKIIRARLFNTIGPRKKGSALADFSKMIVEVERGSRDSIAVGNLEGVIDFTDVEDCVQALWILAEKGTYGEAYNVCSGQGHKLSEMLQKLVSMSGKKIEVYHDPQKIRPLDDPVFIGDNSKLRALGWAPGVTIDTTLKRTLEYWRNTSN